MHTKQQTIQCLLKFGFNIKASLLVKFARFRLVFRLQSVLIDLVLLHIVLIFLYASGKLLLFVSEHKIVFLSRCDTSRSQRRVVTRRYHGCATSHKVEVRARALRYYNASSSPFNPKPHCQFRKCFNGSNVRFVYTLSTICGSTFQCRFIPQLQPEALCSELCASVLLAQMFT